MGHGLTVSQLDAVSKAVFDKTMTQQVYDQTYFFKKLKKEDKVVQSGGTEIRVPVRIKKLGTGDVTGWDTQLVYQDVETRSAIVLDWAKYQATTRITDKDHFINMGGPQQIVNLVRDKTEELRDELSDTLAYDLLTRTSQSGDRMVPLAVIVDNATTYGGIDDADISDWESYESAVTSNKLSRSQLNVAEATSTFQTHSPNVHLTTRQVFGLYDNLIGSYERYEDVDTANMGFNNLKFHNSPVIADAYVPSGYWYGLDMDAYELHVMKGADMALTDWFELKQTGYVYGFAKVATAIMNVVCRRRRTSFKLTGITGTTTV